MVAAAPVGKLPGPHMVMIEAMARSIGLGFEVEELPGVIPIYYRRKGDELRSVSIVRTAPKSATLGRTALVPTNCLLRSAQSAAGCAMP